MCGIFGIVFDKEREDLGKILLEAGRRLTYRGYDSVGMAAFSGTSSELRKEAGKIDEVNRKLHFEEMKGYKGIVQLRWATFGPPCQKNAQPHYDCSGELIGAHNGNIVNTKELIRSLSQKGHRFKGENDGEVCVHAAEEAYKLTGDLGQALVKANRMLQGDYAFCLARAGDEWMYAVKKYSSLYLGVGEGFICCSSDLPSIIPLTRKIVTIKDGEYVKFSAHGYEIHDLSRGGLIKRVPYHCHLNVEQAQKGQYPHFMLKEINEQPERAEAILNYLEKKENLADILPMFKNTGPVYLIGSGSSYNACVIGCYYLNHLAGLEAYPVVAGAFNDLYRKVNAGDTFILVSQSGETKDVINVLNKLEKDKAKRIIALVNVLGSSLHLRVERHIPLLTGVEISVPATKTFLNQVLVFMMLASKIAGLKRKKSPLSNKTWKSLPGLIKTTIDLAQEKLPPLARTLKNKTYLHFLGHGISYGACLEAALKFKEITYIPCEAMYSSEFKHGPLAVISPEDWVIFISTKQDVRMSVSHMNEIACRHGRVALIGPADESFKLNSDFHFEIPADDYYTSPLLSAVAGQVLAYLVSQELGFDPDQPRNISKTLTVD